MTDGKRNGAWVIDLEVDMLGTGERKFPASPFHSCNDIIAYSLETIDGSTGESTLWSRTKIFTPETGYVCAIVTHLDHKRPSKDIMDSWFASEQWHVPAYLVGHNVKFDYHYLRREVDTVGTVHTALPPTIGDVVKSVRSGNTLLWDTQYVEYLLSGQSTCIISLDNLAVEYGLSGKDESVRNLFDGSVNTRDINEDVLRNRVEGDVELTSQIFQRQLKRAIDEGMLGFVLLQLRRYAIVCEYEYNGMWVNTDKLAEMSRELEDEICEHEYACQRAFMSADMSFDFKVDGGQIGLDDLPDWRSDVAHKWFNPDSVKQLRTVLFGGVVKFPEKVKVGVYKTGPRKGQDKFQNQDRYLDFEGAFKEEDFPPGIYPRTPKGLIKVDEKLLQDIAGQEVKPKIGYSSHVENFAKRVLRYRNCKKTLGTFCEATADYIFEDDGCIHPNFNLTVTPTGRLTCSQPNTQQYPSSEDSVFKQVFSSQRVGGVIMSLDFKQLEIVALAYLSGDKNLISDIQGGVDIHGCIRAEAGLSGSSDCRKEVKRIVFGTIYGGGLTKLAASSKLTRSEVSKCIDALTKRYSTAFAGFHCKVRDDIQWQSAERHESGILLRTGIYRLPSGRKITFRQEPSRWRKTEAEWPYSKLKNYPVQGFATGDIEACGVILLFDAIRELNLLEDVHFVNEVHDETVLDISTSYIASRILKEVVPDVEKNLGRFVTNMFDLAIPFDLPLKIEGGYGPNWKEAK